MVEGQNTDDLIARLSADGAPVRRLRPPAIRALLWLGGALAVIAALVVYHGMRPDLGAAMAEPGGWLSFASAAATGVAATFAAFYLAIPGTSSRWALLPLPVAILWASGLSLGCYADWIRAGPDGIHLGDSFDCFRSIVLTSLFLGLPLGVMLRFGRFVRPVATAAMGGLAVSSLVSAGLELFHRSDARIMDVVWHTAAVVLIVLVSSGSGAASKRGALKTSV